MIVAELTEHVVAGDMGLLKDCHPNGITWITSFVPEEHPDGY